MSVTKKNFGKNENGQEVTLYTMKNKNGMVAEVTDYGAILVNLFVPDKAGNVDDIVLGFDKVDGYFGNGSFFGATIGPNANRIADACFSIDGVRYQLAVNDNQNNLHSDEKIGYHKRMWAAECGDNKVVFTLTDEETMGFPGTKQVAVTYELTDDNEVKISYEADSDKKTLINMTNHTYFNLVSHDAAPIHDHQMCILASHYTPVVAGAIPTGEIAPVEGTVFDFRKPMAVGDHVEDDIEQLKLVEGYDHNWVIDDFDGKMKKVAVVTEPTKGRTMEVYTDLPGVQFYAGNCIKPETGKGGASYGKRSGLCLETQAFPDSVNRENFPDVIYGPDRRYETTTIYKFIW